MKMITKEQARINFDKNYSRLNLPSDLIGKKFEVEGIEYEVLGLSQRLRKNPIIVQKTNSVEIFRFNLDSIKSLISA